MGVKTETLRSWRRDWNPKNFRSCQGQAVVFFCSIWSSNRCLLFRPPWNDTAQEGNKYLRWILYHPHQMLKQHHKRHSSWEESGWRTSSKSVEPWQYQRMCLTAFLRLKCCVWHELIHLVDSIHIFRSGNVGVLQVTNSRSVASRIIQVIRSIARQFIFVGKDAEMPLAVAMSALCWRITNILSLE